MSGKITVNELSSSLIEYLKSLIKQEISDSGGGPSSGGGSTTTTSNVTYLKSSVELTTTGNTVTIPTSFSFNKSKDLLFVFKNSVYLEENYDYTISSGSTTITAVDGDDWVASPNTPALFNFVVLKNVSKG